MQQPVFGNGTPPHNPIHGPLDCPRPSQEVGARKRTRRFMCSRVGDFSGATLSSPAPFPGRWEDGMSTTLNNNLVGFDGRLAVTDSPTRFANRRHICSDKTRDVGHTAEKGKNQRETAIPIAFRVPSRDPRVRTGRDSACHAKIVCVLFPSPRRLELTGALRLVV